MEGLFQELCSNMSVMDRIEDLARSNAVSRFKDVKIRIVSQAIDKLSVGPKTGGKHH